MAWPENQYRNLLKKFMIERYIENSGEIVFHEELKPQTYIDLAPSPNSEEVSSRIIFIVSDDELQFLDIFDQIAEDQLALGNTLEIKGKPLVKDAINVANLRAILDDRLVAHIRWREGANVIHLEGGLGWHPFFFKLIWDYAHQ